MEIVRGSTCHPKRSYAVEEYGFPHFLLTLWHRFCKNFIQRFIIKKVHRFSDFVVLCSFLNDASLKSTLKSWNFYSCTFSVRKSGILRHTCHISGAHQSGSCEQTCPFLRHMILKRDLPFDSSMYYAFQMFCRNDIWHEVWSCFHEGIDIVF